MVLFMSSSRCFPSSIPVKTTSPIWPPSPSRVCPMCSRNCSPFHCTPTCSRIIRQDTHTTRSSPPSGHNFFVVESSMNFIAMNSNKILSIILFYLLILNTTHDKPTPHPLTSTTSMVGRPDLQQVIRQPGFRKPLFGVEIILYIF